MAIDVRAIQLALREDGIDAWLLYDFHGSNPIAHTIVGLSSTAKLTTRRWYYLIPASGKPRALMHTIEPDSLSHLPGKCFLYAGREELASRLSALVEGHRRVAMEYSPNGAIPYVSKVDAGTVDAIRALGVDVVSSGDLVQRFEAVWSDDALRSHREASVRLYDIKDRTFALLRERALAGSKTTEFEIQQAMVGWFKEHALVTDCPPVVAARENGGNPHYLPTADASRQIDPGDPVLIDLWGKLDAPGTVYADITWMAYLGAQVPDEYASAFAVVAAARDAAVALVTDATSEGRELRGWEIDRTARDVIAEAGLGQYFVHRTGHSLGESVHGNGVHMDDYETHDDRRLLPGTGFTIEPGVYFDTFGIRSEINMFVGRGQAVVTGPVQAKITALMAAGSE